MDREPRMTRRSLPWGLAGLGLALVASALGTWATVGNPPGAVIGGLVASVAAGMTCFVVAAVLRARAEGVSTLRVIGRVLLAPVRFLFELVP